MRKKVIALAMATGALAFLTAATSAFVGSGDLSTSPSAVASAYSKATPHQISYFAEDAIHNARSSMGSFALGVASAANLNDGIAKLKQADGITLNENYFAAGQRFQIENQMTKDEILEFVDRVSVILEKSDPAVRVMKTNPEGGIQAYSEIQLQQVALLRGIIAAGEGQVKVDSRLLERMDRLLYNQDGQLHEELKNARQAGFELGQPLAQGNDRLWAAVSQRLRNGPVEARQNRHKPVKPTEFTDQVPEIVERDYLTNAVIDPFAAANPELEKTDNLRPI